MSKKYEITIESRYSVRLEELTDEITDRITENYQATASLARLIPDSKIRFLDGKITIDEKESK